MFNLKTIRFREHAINFTLSESESCSSAIPEGSDDRLGIVFGKERISGECIVHLKKEGDYCQL